MKPFLFLILFIITGCQSDKPDECHYIDKEFPLHLQLKILQTNDTAIDLQFILRNDSSETAILYKPLLPLNNSVSENIFSIRDTAADYKILEPTFTSNEKHCGDGWGETGGPILPNFKSNNFIFLKPHDSILSTIDLYNYYDFSEARRKGKKHFELSSFIKFPLVDKTIQQVTDWDTIYYKYNPVYFEEPLLSELQTVNPALIEFDIP